MHQRILSSLATYNQATGSNLTFTPLWTYDSNGHWVAWMEMEYAPADSREASMGSGRSPRGLFCACDFLEGQGWQRAADGSIRKLHGRDCCAHRQAAIYYRQLELRQAYLASYVDQDACLIEVIPPSRVPDVVRDLLERSRNGEFIGEEDQLQTGAFSLENLKVITNLKLRCVWERVQAMHEVQLHGTAVCELSQSEAGA